MHMLAHWAQSFLQIHRQTPAHNKKSPACSRKQCAQACPDPDTPIHASTNKFTPQITRANTHTYMYICGRGISHSFIHTHTHTAYAHRLSHANSNAHNLTQSHSAAFTRTGVSSAHPNRKTHNENGGQSRLQCGTRC